MSNCIIRVIVEKQPDLHEEPTTAMMTRGRYQGCYVKLYSDTREGGLKIGKFLLREDDGQEEIWKGVPLHKSFVLRQ